MKKKEGLDFNYMFTSLRRITKSGWLGFFREGGLSFATIFIMVMTIFLITSLFLSKDISQYLIASVQERVDVSVYFKADAAENDIFNLKEEIARIPQVKDVEYVSKEEALDEFVKRHKSDSTLMESLTEVGGNPFFPALNIKAFEANQYETIVNFLSKADFGKLIEKVDYYQRKSAIDRIFSFTSTIKKIGIVLAIILVIVAILSTFNTIRLAIYNNREEIKIQRLVGASNWFIRGPFIIQGIIAGILASLICLVLSVLVCWAIGAKMEGFFPGLNIFEFYQTNLRNLILLQFGTGIALGFFSSLIAIRRHLRV